MVGDDVAGAASVLDPPREFITTTSAIAASATPPATMNFIDEPPDAAMGATGDGSDTGVGASIAGAGALFLSFFLAAFASAFASDLSSATVGTTASTGNDGITGGLVAPAPNKAVAPAGALSSGGIVSSGGSAGRSMTAVVCRAMISTAVAAATSSIDADTTVSPAPIAVSVPSTEMRAIVSSSVIHVSTRSTALPCASRTTARNRTLSPTRMDSGGLINSMTAACASRI